MANRRARLASIRQERRRTVLTLESLEGRAVPAVLATPMSVSVAEGQTKQVAFKLNKAPTADVTFTLQSSNPAEATIDTQSLTFTPLNWKTPQVVTVSAIEDYVKDGNKSLKIITSVSASTDKNYANKAVPDPMVKTLDSRKLPPIDPAVYQGTYSGSFTGRGASGPIDATVSGRMISVAIRINAPTAGIVDSPASGSGTINDDGTFSFTAQGSIFGAVYTGKILFNTDGTVSGAGGTWKYRTLASGTWQVDRISVDPPVDAPV